MIGVTGMRAPPVWRGSWRGERGERRYGGCGGPSSVAGADLSYCVCDQCRYAAPLVPCASVGCQALTQGGLGTGIPEPSVMSKLPWPRAGVPDGDGD